MLCGPFEKLGPEDSENIIGLALERIEETISSEAMFFDLVEVAWRLMRVIEAGVPETTGC